MFLYLLEMTPPNRVQVEMPLFEILGNRGQLLLHFGFGESERAAEDIDDSRADCGNEWPDQNACAVRAQRDAARLMTQAAHDCRMSACAAPARVSSTSER